MKLLKAVMVGVEGMRVIVPGSEVRDPWCGPPSRRTALRRDSFRVKDERKLAQN
jgi:ribosomal protein S12 methylthiotransferase accessory factor YcaO